ncbi:MAG: FG-GAP-like repeat-containing protein [Candidatus Thalassarchaeaceae archaeon]|nr:FG-GAP-like repeat-containing protein [Candidatus Thalassarchaeaceae archaeon]
MNRGLTSLLCALFFVSMFSVSLDNGQQLLPQLNDLESGGTGNHENRTIGGYHIASEEWWQPNRPFNVSTSDWDGDGSENIDDSHPFNPAIPTRSTGIRGTSCTNHDDFCYSDPNPVTFRSDSNQIDPVSIQALDVEWGDIDGDGDLDVAVGNAGVDDGVISNHIYLNDGVKLISPAVWTSKEEGITFNVELVDLDNDGDLDLATADYPGAVLLYRNENGVISDTPFWNYSYGNFYQSGISGMDWGDINGDNYPDLLIGVYNQALVVIKNGPQGMENGLHWSISGNIKTVDVAFADINNDGKLDVVDGGLEKNRVYLNSGSSMTPYPVWQSQNQKQTSSIALGDVNGDGYTDLVVGNRLDVNELYLNSGGSNPNLPALPTWTSQNQSATMDIELADIDNDGDLDFIEASANERDYIQLYWGSSYHYGSMDAWASLDEGDSGAVAWGDVDGDGDIDFITADGDQGILLSINGGYSIRDDSEWTNGISEDTVGLELVDMDGDKDLDILFSNLGSDSVVYKNTGSGYQQFWDTNYNYHAHDMILFDVNDDQVLDLIIADYNSNNKAWGGNGVGSSYTISQTSGIWASNDANSHTVDLLSGDVNGDNIDDLIELNNGTNNIHYMVQTGQSGNYQLNQGNSWTSNDQDNSLCGALGDIDNDGTLDLLVANYDGPVKLYYNDNIFGLEQSAGWESNYDYNASGCALGDVNGDGWLDAVISVFDAPNLLFINNNGNFQNTPTWVTPEQDYTTSIGLWDIDGDNDLDWVEGNGFGSHWNANAKNLVRENREGNFSMTIWESPDYLSASQVKLGDLDKDGDLDMIVANSGSPNQIYLGVRDQDGDWIGEEDGDDAPFDPTQSIDSDGDGFGESLQGWRPDNCQNTWGDSWRDRWGCPDLDHDGQSDLYDPFMQKNTQWSDIDGDGLGDNWADPSLNSTREPIGLGEWVENAFLPDSSPWDYDNDGFDDEYLDGSSMPFDDCPYQPGTSHVDRFGCADADTDGRSDEGDAFPGDRTQWNDSDGDGFGDNSKGNQPDSCISIVGTSTMDVFGCPDTDGDGWSEEGDFDPNNPAVWSDEDEDGFDDQLSDGCLNEKGGSTEDRGGCKDHDRDGYSDPDSDSPSHPNGDADAFPYEGTQWRNQDGDDYGDNPEGFQPDSCTDTYGTSQFKITNGEFDDWYGCSDQDNDGLYDGDDQCPLVGGTSTIDRFGCPDSDNDGMSDLNDDCELQAGDSTVEFIACPDTDSDGIPDSIDPEPSDGRGSADDWDADGWNQTNDAFPNDSTQWEDGDGDGLGDNPNGTNPDPLPGDKDNDGWPDSNDSFINNPNEWLDTDGDGIGDNADTDDDGDGYSDILEEQVGTDPKDANSHTVESWELMIPGTRIGLSWWDLLGIMAGIPLASWLGYGLVTRNRRVAEFEEELSQATTKEGIEEVAIRAEHALMLRLIGPHQAIRLERLRAELDDALGVEGFPITSEQTEIVLDDMELIHEDAYVPEIPDTSINYQITESDGYEWKNENGKFHYRVKDGDGVWLPWGE